MVQGFNSDVTWRGHAYHVQTEDWGARNPYLVSRVFQNGAVVKSVKTGYQEVLPRGTDKDQRTIRLALQLQHEQILDLLLSGKLL